MIYCLVVAMVLLTLHFLNILSPFGPIRWRFTDLATPPARQAVSPHYRLTMGVFTVTLSLSSVSVPVNQRVIPPALPSIFPLITMLLDFSHSALRGKQE